MSQNKNKLIQLFVGNVSNSIIHEILEKAIDKEEIADKYRKELIESFEIAKRYREKINPKDVAFPEREALSIKNKIISRVKTELLLRISKGYMNINLSLIESETDNVLRVLNVV